MLLAKHEPLKVPQSKIAIYKKVIKARNLNKWMWDGVGDIFQRAITKEFFFS